jgi:hypothetical protein
MMRQRVLNSVTAVVVAVPTVLAAGAGTAIADGPTGSGGATGGGGATIMPFAQTYRRCDFSANMHTPPVSFSRPIAYVHTAGSEVIADVQIATALPNTPYDVRLIQMPRSSASSCNPGDPGVSGAVLWTDPVGGGSVTVRGPVASGATGVWLYVTRPGEFSQTPEEFYTTDYVAAL